MLLPSVVLLACGSGSEPIVVPSPVVPPDAPAGIQLFVSAPTVMSGHVVEVVATVKSAAGVILPSAPVVFSTDNAALAVPGAAGEINALAPGNVLITARSGNLSSTANLTITPATAADPSAWTFCVKAGNVCDFAGLRRVRLGAASGPYVTQTSFHGVPCASFGFGDVDPAPGQSLHCDYGPALTTVINNPAPGMGVDGATVTVPLGAAGFATDRIQKTTDIPVVTDGSGSFRTTCDLAAVAFDDPIVFPNQPGASHLHIFFGNTSVRAGTTVTSIAAAGASTCRGGSINRTGYWVPAVIDKRNGEVQIPDLGIFYYKSGYNMDPRTIQPFPVGLQMIAGDRTATAAQPNTGWSCRDRYTGDFASIPTTCGAADFVRLEIQFPQCWDGRNLDSPNHKSHMAFPDYRDAPARSTCPSTHPVPLPAITEKFDYPVAGRNPATWRLSSDMYAASLPGGLSAHADWMYGWNPDVMQKIITNCIAKGVDCGVASLGNGTELY